MTGENSTKAQWFTNKLVRWIRVRTAAIAVQQPLLQGIPLRCFPRVLSISPVIQINEAGESEHPVLDARSNDRYGKSRQLQSRKLVNWLSSFLRVTRGIIHER
jgi:hypothetical protein